MKKSILLITLLVGSVAVCSAAVHSSKGPRHDVSYTKHHCHHCHMHHKHHHHVK